MKFAKYSYGINPETGNEGYAIVQPLDENDKEVIRVRLKFGTLESTKGRIWGRIIYGTAVEYRKSGIVCYFDDLKSIEELDTDTVLNEHFVGLI